MFEKPGLRVGHTIVAQALQSAFDGQFKIDLIQVALRKVVLDGNAPNNMELSRHVRQKNSRILNVKLIGIEMAPPVSVMGCTSEFIENFPAQRFLKNFPILLPRNDALASHSQDFFPCAVFTNTVVNKNPVAP